MLDAVAPAPLVTVLVRVNGSAAPAVNWMLFVPEPAVMVPPLIAQAYVADGCDATLAGTPLALAVTAPATVMVGFGVGKIATVAELVACWDAAVVTVTLTVADGVAVALNVIWLVPVPAVITPPPAIDHE